MAPQKVGMAKPRRKPFAWGGTGTHGCRFRVTRMQTLRRRFMGSQSKWSSQSCLRQGGIAAALLGLGLFAAGCSEQVGTKQGVGTLLGAGTGALVGSQFGGGSGQLAAVAIGALAGGFLGNEAGKSLDQADQQYMTNTTQSTLETAPTGRASNWHNPDTGNSGQITPTRTYRGTTGETCREFQQTIIVGGRTENAFGTACRQSDGSWRIVP
jgi:surface antigen